MSLNASYRLLLAQPDPDLDERVCIGLLFEESDRHPELVYDRKLAKLRCVAPSLDLELFRVFLEAFDASLHQSRDIDGVVSAYRPQIMASAKRRVAAPVTDGTKLALLSRFVIGDAPKASAVEVQARRTHKEQIHRFLDRVADGLNLPVVERIRTEDVFGRSIPSVEAVAFGVRTPTKTILVDGVDFHSSSPRQSINETNRVVHAFWQWGRLRHSNHGGMFDPRFERVGVILNGVVPKGKQIAKFLDAHEYARAKLQSESDLIVDSSSDVDARKFRDLLVGGH